MESPRRSPRIAEKYGASPRVHFQLYEEHPYRDVLNAKRGATAQREAEPNRGALCALTTLVISVWGIFLGTVLYKEYAGGRQPFNWEMNAGMFNPYP